MGLCSFGRFTVVWFSSAVLLGRLDFFFFFNFWDFSLHLFSIEIKSEIMFILQWTHVGEASVSTCVQVLTHLGSQHSVVLILLIWRESVVHCLSFACCVFTATRGTWSHLHLNLQARRGQYFNTRTMTDPKKLLLQHFQSSRARWILKMKGSCKVLVTTGRELSVNDDARTRIKPHGMQPFPLHLYKFDPRCI